MRGAAELVVWVEVGRGSGIQPDSAASNERTGPALIIRSRRGTRTGPRGVAWGWVGGARAPPCVISTTRQSMDSLRRGGGGCPAPSPSSIAAAAGCGSFDQTALPRDHSCPSAGGTPLCLRPVPTTAWRGAHVESLLSRWPWRTTEGYETRDICARKGNSILEPAA